MSSYKIIIEKESTRILIMSIFLAFIVSLVPWEYFRASDYYDRQNYFNYITLYLNKIYWFDFEGLLKKVSYEWGWHFFLDYLSVNLSLNANQIIFLITFIVLTISFWLVSREKGLYALILLFHPIYIDFFYSQIRLSFAITFVYMSLMAYKKNKLFSFLILIPAFFIHTSTFIFVLIFYSAYILESIKIISNRIKFLWALCIGLLAAFATGPYMSLILGSIEDRRSEYNDMSSPVLYMSFWLMLFVIYVINYSKNNNNCNINYYSYISISVLSMVFLNIFISGYSSRFLAASFPFVILSMLDLSKENKLVIISTYILYTILLWGFWLT